MISVSFYLLTPNALSQSQVYVSISNKENRLRFATGESFITSYCNIRKKKGTKELVKKNTEFYFEYRSKLTEMRDTLIRIEMSLTEGASRPSLAQLSAGSYTCSVTDANSCTATQSFVITEPAALMAMSSSTAILCNGGSSTVTVNAMDGTAPYTGTGTFSASAGSYAYPVTDANGCSTSTTGTITEPAAITGIQSPSICVGENYQVGTSTYTTFGTYTDVLTAFNGCDSTVTTNLTVNSLPSLSVAAADTNVCVSSSAVSLIALPLGGTWTGAGILGSTFSPSIAGAGTHIITYTYTDINACASTAEITMVVDLCTGINAVSNTASFTVYPNPTNSSLTINTSVNYTSIQIVNTLGQVVFTKEKSTVLNVSSLPSGIYFIQLVDNKGSVIDKEKFVKE